MPDDQILYNTAQEQVLSSGNMNSQSGHQLPAAMSIPPKPAVANPITANLNPADLNRKMLGQQDQTYETQKLTGE